MNSFIVATASLNQTPFSWGENKANILCAIDNARSFGARIVCLPELCISSYGCEDFFLSKGVQKKSLEVLEEILPATQDLAVCVGMPLLVNQKLYNAAVVICDGKILGATLKRYLANDGIHYEARWFSAWELGKSEEIELLGQKIFVGDVDYEIFGKKVAIEICRDSWVPNRPAKKYENNPIDIILNPSASHFAFDKAKLREGFIFEGSTKLAKAFIYSNLLGCESGRAIYDGGALIAVGGAVVAKAKRFSFEDYQVVTFDLNSSRITLESAYLDKTLKKDSFEATSSLKEEEFSRAVSLGLFDYLKKTKTRGFALSLSGGADSSCILSLVYLMQKFGVLELGEKRFREVLNLDPCLDILEQLLTCVYQRTKNNSEETYTSAKELAEALGAKFLLFDIDKIVSSYTEVVQSAIGRELSFEKDGLAIENIQARVRAPSIWMIANLESKILLATSNRSEASVGYATMDGDTAGGLCPIAGVDKDFIRKYLLFLEKEGCVDAGKISALRHVNSLEPSAELKPREASQTDEKELMPYEILNAIEKGLIYQKKSKREVLEELKQQFPEQKFENLSIYVKRFALLWTRNQWKRERFAPAFHLDHWNVDSKTWCRFPILSSLDLGMNLKAVDQEIDDAFV